MVRGGKREGAGRPAPQGRRVTLAVRVLPSTKQYLQDIKGERSIGQVIDELVEQNQNE